MALYLMGLGLDILTITEEEKRTLEKCKKIYLEGYTVDFPYTSEDLEKVLGKKIQILEREEVENEEILKEAKNEEVALLVYGDSLSATTHTQLILSCKNQNIQYRVYHNASIMTAIASTGLQLYKFGKTTSMPCWKKSYEPTSFIKIYKENKSIEAHTLILTDIGLEIDKAIYQLEESCNREGFEIKKPIIIISNAGTQKQKIYYDKIHIIKQLQIEKPFCIIIPEKMHFIEEEALESFKEELII